MSAHLEAIIDRCLEARETARESDEEFIGQLLDAVLFAAACRLAKDEGEALKVSAAVERHERSEALMIRIVGGAKRAH